jgi:BirA family transcriptional regulator, biotin operon repressor / biotin---[acetyl-CoA-carboxylase] ligase
MASSVPLSFDSIRSTLATQSLGHSLYIHQELGSTNTEALSLAQGGAAHGTVVVAEGQSGGHGRHGRVWFSPPGVNIYCSIILRELGRNLPLPQWLSWIPLVSAVAVAEAIQQVAAIRLSLKWPNDLLLHERKIGGILCESTFATANAPIVVIGIGLNVNLPLESFPEELRAIATSLYEASQQPIDRNCLLAQLLLELEHCLIELGSHGTVHLRHAYVSRCATLGRQVRVLFSNDQHLIGTAEAISADGSLQVRASSPPSEALIDVRAADVIHLKE